MSLPGYQSFMTPLLQCLANGETVKLKEIEAHVYQSIGLSVEQLKLRIPSGKQTYAYHRLSWAKTYLVKAGLFGSCGVPLISHPPRIYLQWYPSLVESVVLR